MKSFNEFLQQKLSEDNTTEKYPSLDDLSSSEYRSIKDKDQIKKYIDQAGKKRDIEALLHLKKMANKAGHHDLVDMADAALNKK